MPSSLPEPQKERGFPFTPSRKKKLLIFKRESTRSAPKGRNNEAQANGLGSDSPPFRRQP